MAGRLQSGMLKELAGPETGGPYGPYRQVGLSFESEVSIFSDKSSPNGETFTSSTLINCLEMVMPTDVFATRID